MPIEPFPVPEDLPDEIINSPAPVPTVQPSPDETKEPDDDDDEEPPPPEPEPTEPEPGARADAHARARADGRPLAYRRRRTPVAEERVVDLRAVPTDTCRCDSDG